MRNWDYDLPINWQPKTPKEWVWFLVRKINYGDFRGLNAADIKKYFQKIKKKIDPGKSLLLENFLEK